MKITTAGDVDRARGDKSRWVGALEAALLAGEIDLAVHSAKDVPGELAPGTAIVATPRRAEPFDVLVGEARWLGARGRAGGDERAAPPRAAAGRAAGPRGRASCAATSTRGWPSARRARSTRWCWPPPGWTGWAAAARRARCCTTACSSRPPGQGVIAIQARAGSPAARRRCAPTTRATHAALDAERHVVRALEASCHTPVGVLALGGGVRGVRRPAGRLGVARRGGRPTARSWPAALLRRGRGRAAAERLTP